MNDSNGYEIGPTVGYCSQNIGKMLYERGYFFGIAHKYVGEFDMYPEVEWWEILEWLRTKHNIWVMISIGCDVDAEPKIFYNPIITKFGDDGSSSLMDPFDYYEFKDPNEAIEKGVEWVLTNLVENDQEHIFYNTLTYEL